MRFINPADHLEHFNKNNNFFFFSHMATHPNNAKYPDAIALAFDQRNLKLTCVYNDHSLYVWDVRDIKRVSDIL
jgi:hypothetical protein